MQKKILKNKNCKKWQKQPLSHNCPGFRTANARIVKFLRFWKFDASLGPRRQLGYSAVQERESNFKILSLMEERFTRFDWPKTQVKWMNQSAQSDRSWGQGYDAHAMFQSQITIIYVLIDDSPHISWKLQENILFRTS